MRLSKNYFMKKFILLISISFFFSKNFSQNCSSLNIQWQSDFNGHTCGGFSPLTMTMIHDQNNLPYVYIANKEGGMKVYDVSAVSTPSLVATVPITLYDSMEVMSLCQSGNYVYLAVGNNFDTLAKQGMAIVDVTNPTSPTVTNYWENPGGKSGSGAVAVEGNYAYLCAMQTGLIILDITNKNSIQYVSKFKPSINFPPVANPDPKKINARGIEVQNSIVYCCYDAGGFRIINCTNKNSPKETGRWCNPAMYTPLDHPKAYNNLVIDDTLAYIAVDYAGLEVLDIKDTGNIKMLGWWNPYKAPAQNWFTSPSHCNEIKLEKNCKRVFISSGKSDMQVIDVSNPLLPDSCNYYGGASNNIGTWGIDMWQNQIYLSYICTLGVPFASNWTGVKLLAYNSCAVGVEEINANDIFIFPNPASNKITIESSREINWKEIKTENALGQNISSSFTRNGNKVEVNISGLKTGIYFLKINAGGKEIIKKFVK